MMAERTTGHCVTGNSPCTPSIPGRVIFGWSVFNVHARLDREGAHRLEVILPSLGIDEMEVGHGRLSRPSRR